MIERVQISNSSCEKLLCVFFDSKLIFQSHIDNICKKASQKLNTISRIAPHMEFNKKISCLFHGSVQLLPINMMGDNRVYNNKINRLHESVFD